MLEDDPSDSDQEEIKDEVATTKTDVTENKTGSDDVDATLNAENSSSKSKSDLDWLKGKVTKTKVKVLKLKNSDFPYLL